MTTIEEGKTYTPADPEWSAVIAELREDEVEAWEGPHGLSGTLVDHDGVLCVGCWSVTGVIRRKDGAPNPELTRLTVTKLAPREPSWAGARVVLDVEGGGKFPRIRRADGMYVAAHGMTHTVGEISGDEHVVLLDSDGRIPVDSVLLANGVTRAVLLTVALQAIHGGRPGFVTDDEVHAAEVAVDAILAALDGGAR